MIDFENFWRFFTKLRIYPVPNEFGATANFGYKTLKVIFFQCHRCSFTKLISFALEWKKYSTSLFLAIFISHWRLWWCVILRNAYLGFFLIKSWRYLCFLLHFVAILCIGFWLQMSLKHLVSFGRITIEIFWSCFL